jgi:hypothetical protein
MNRLWSLIPPAAAADPLVIAVAEIEVAIELVLRGTARRVRLVGLLAGERAAGEGLALAQEAGVQFALERGAAPGYAVSLVIGPAIDD